jgi:hypothetical protein
MSYIDIVFERMPDHEGANFIEVEDASGASIRAGKWLLREDGYVALRIQNGPTLEGATELPPENTRIRTAGEFAALWNAKSPQERDDFMVQLLHQQDTTLKCFVEDHAGAVEQRNRPPLVNDSQLGRLAQLVYTGLLEEPDIEFSMPMTAKLLMVQILAKALGEVGFTSQVFEDIKEHGHG